MTVAKPQASGSNNNPSGLDRRTSKRHEGVADTAMKGRKLNPEANQ